MRLLLAIAHLTVPGIGLAVSAQAVGRPDVRPMLSFEADQIARLAQRLKATRTEGKAADGTPTVRLAMNPFSGFSNWTMYEGNASDGKVAVGIGPTRLRLYLDAYKDLPADSLLQRAVDYYGIFQDNWAAGAGTVFHTVGAFRRVFPMDWSAYDLLRIDVYCHEVAQTIRLVLEDEQIGPPVVRNVTVAAGKWVTFEVDLRAAAKQRGLDLSRMATLAATVAKLDGTLKTKRKHTALLDNFRLAKAGSPAKRPIVRDDSPHTLPECFRASANPQPEALPLKGDHSPLTREEPILIKTAGRAVLTPVGWVAAYDNRHLMVGFNRGAKNGHVLQSADGGRTWGGLDGKREPTVVGIRELTHQCGPGDAVGRRADVLVLTNLGCNGPAMGSLRLFAQKLTFTGRGWTLRQTAALVDFDLRHCNSNQSIVRGADGRLWAGYGLVGRLGTLCINVRYSDDDGVTWRSSREGTSGVVPASIRSADAGGFGYTHEEPRLVPFGQGVACFWQQRTGYAYGKVLWSRFDGKRWSPAEGIAHPKRSAYNPTRPPIHAVSLRGEEIFLVSAWFDGVLHYRDGKWTVEAPGVPAGSRISLAGDGVVMAIAVTSEKADMKDSAGHVAGNIPVTLRAWRRNEDGTWTKPRDLATEPTPLASSGGRYYARPGFVVQPYAPPNFVPVAWSCGKNWIKLLRVPVASGWTPAGR